MSTEKEGSTRPGIITRISRFFAELKGETKKVVWPSKKQVINNTGIVIATVCVTGLAIGGVDFILSLLVKLIFAGA